MPFSFTTRDVYDLDLRATVNAKSGVERVTSRRNQVELVVPQTELLQLWARQEDFDDSLRLDRQAPYWATGPRRPRAGTWATRRPRASSRTSARTRTVRFRCSLGRHRSDGYCTGQGFEGAATVAFEERSAPRRNAPCPVSPSTRPQRNQNGGPVVRPSSPPTQARADHTATHGRPRP